MKHQASGQLYQLEPLGFFFYLYISVVRHTSLIFYFSASNTFVLCLFFPSIKSLQSKVCESE